MQATYAMKLYHAFVSHYGSKITHHGSNRTVEGQGTNSSWKTCARKARESTLSGLVQRNKIAYSYIQGLIRCEVRLGIPFGRMQFFMPAQKSLNNLTVRFND